MRRAASGRHGVSPRRVACSAPTGRGRDAPRAGPRRRRSDRCDPAGSAGVRPPERRHLHQHGPPRRAPGHGAVRTADRRPGHLARGHHAAVPGHRPDRGGRGAQPRAAPVGAAPRGPGHLAHAVRAGGPGQAEHRRHRAGGRGPVPVPGRARRGLLGRLHPRQHGGGGGAGAAPPAAARPDRHRPAGLPGGGRGSGPRGRVGAAAPGGGGGPGRSQPGSFRPAARAAA